MTRYDYTGIINELSASERIFTTAQAGRLGVPRNVIAKACARGRLVRVLHGAYRMAGVPPRDTDELEALWKSTAPAMFTHERAAHGAWDGICVGGSTAACVLGIGDFYLTPYRLLAPRRVRTRADGASFAVRGVERADVDFSRGFPVTRCERTLLDLALDQEDPSLLSDAAADALAAGLDRRHLSRLVAAESRTTATAELLAFLERGDDGI